MRDCGSPDHWRGVCAFRREPSKFCKFSQGLHAWLALLPLLVKAIAHAHVKTDKIDAGVLASLRAAGFLPEVWVPDAATERRRRLVARRNQVIRHRTRIKNEVHAILQAHLIPPCPHADLLGRLGRSWLGWQELPDDKRAAIERHLRELDRLAEDLDLLDREIAEEVIEDTCCYRRADDQPGAADLRGKFAISGLSAAPGRPCSNCRSCQERTFLTGLRFPPWRR